MDLDKIKVISRVGVGILVCLLVAACHKTVNVKKTAVDPVKRARLEWNYATTLDAYPKAGFSGRKWNDPAARALAEFAATRARVLEPNEPTGKIIGTNAAAAVRAGCKDPMVNYLFIKYSMSQTNSKDDFANAFRQMADTMQASSYPMIRKFYASLRTAQQFNYAAGNSANTPPEVQTYRQQAMANLATALEDQWMPVEEVDDACHEMLEELDRNQQQYVDCYQLIERPLLKNWPDKPLVPLLKGEAEIRKAWFARGNGYANKVTPEGWKLFAEHLAAAKQALNQAWELDSSDERVPTQMIRLALGLEENRSTMELWFNRAMAINPNCYAACTAKLRFLFPQWYGSREDMLAFGRECVANTNWGGTVPLILVDAHWECAHRLDADERPNYWQLPDVWPDIKSAFDRYFELNPQDIGRYHPYVRYAYQAKQWRALNELLPKLGQVDYEYFGGREEFDKIVQAAADHAH